MSVDDVDPVWRFIGLCAVAAVLLAYRISWDDFVFMIRELFRRNGGSSGG